MKKISITALVLSVIFFTTGCQTGIESDLEKMAEKYDALNNEYNELNSNYKKLNKKYDELEILLDSVEREKEELYVRYNEITQENEEIETKYSNNENIERKLKKVEKNLKILGGFNEIIISQKFIKENSDKYIVNTYNNIFSPQKVKVGDIINGFEVTKVLSTDDNQEGVWFRGRFILTGELIVNEIGDSHFGIMCNQTEVSRSIPIPLSWLPSYKNIFLRIDNNDTVAEAIGTERKERMVEFFDGGDFVTYKITAVFEDFYYASKPQTDIGSRVTLVEILSIEELIN